MKMDRRGFIGAAAAATLAQSLPSWAQQAAKGAAHPLAGKKLPAWKRGSMRITIHYTGRSESTFAILPDSTSLLIDCGEYVYRDGAGANRQMPFAPKGLTAGEAICRSILRDNPNGKKVDYFVLTHYHSDHAGSLKCGIGPWPRAKGGKGGYAVCGMGRAIEMLDFGTMIDRSWPDMNDPAVRAPDFDDGTPAHAKAVYEEAAGRGIKVERFRLEKGSDQIRPLHGGFEGFGYTPLCARGLVLKRDGSVLDLGGPGFHGGRLPRSKFPENPLSVGFVLSYGDFRYYTAGDFEDPAFEDALAAECPRVDVAKCNHHATNTMSVNLVKALDASLWLTGGCWHPAHTGRSSMRRMNAGWRPGSVVAPGFFPVKRRKEDAAEPWLGNLAKECFKPCHTVVDVAPGGASYTLAMVDASVEDGLVLGAYDFKTTRKEKA